ncbi:YkgJ family cysteine cluster protein [Vibrio barjaei]|uniref:YkgJ family cysteine cluster protein n=1 Tax=Vibrio barjaei TaxID=1676683 RepID=UPI0022842828|nr:YkgJ family cysteine cluster protein [Vibrio barjaei]MCY9872958.1 YkgJ family cysteine cluster protein [Vibrio barjaei]
MITRNVKPENEIPTFFLTEEAQKSRIKSLTNRSLSPEAEQALREIFELFGSIDTLTTDVFKQFYSLLDTYSADIAALSCCTAGCNACCYVPISVSLPEAMYLSEATGIELNKKPTNKHMEYHGSKCPFLKDGACSAYEARPINCRLFFAIDHYKYCYADKEHNIMTSASQGNLHKLILWLAKVSDGHYKSGGYDIREWFPIIP